MMDSEDSGSEMGVKTERVQKMGKIAIAKGFQRLIGSLFNVQTYKGDPSGFQDWLEALQKKKFPLGLTDQVLVMLAYDRSAGPVSKLIWGLCEQDPLITWEELKKALMGRFSSE